MLGRMSESSFPGARAGSPIAVETLARRLGPEFTVAGLQRVQALDPDGRSGLMLKLLQMYAEVMQTQAAAMSDHAAHGRLEALKSVAHAVRSSSLSVGAEDFAQACQQLERRIGEPGGDPAQLCAEGAALGHRALRLCRAVQQSLPTDPAAGAKAGPGE